MCIFFSCKTTPRKPDSQITDSVYQAGAFTGDSFDHTFYIKSTGGADLIIDTVSSSCDCTNVTWQKGPIKTGDSAFVKVTVKPQASFRGEASTYLLIKTNGKKQLNALTVIYKKNG
ncbi:hypothetical protein GCM10028827_39250 [Mucilaginibacter myungsuensis]